MNKTLWSGAFATVTCVAALGLAAQTPSPSSSQSGTNSVTVSGCIRRTVEIHTDTAGTAALWDPDTTTQLVITTASAETRNPAGTAGATNRSGSLISTTPIYRLDDMDESLVSRYIGQTVEISGTLDEEHHDSTAAAPNVTSSKLTVHSVKMLWSSCPDEP